jgi:hypothetical protein
MLQEQHHIDGYTLEKITCTESNTHIIRSKKTNRITAFRASQYTTF